MPIYFTIGLKHTIISFFYLFSYTTVFPKWLEELRLLPMPFIATGWSLSVEEFFYLIFPLSFSNVIKNIFGYFVTLLLLASLSMFLSKIYLGSGAYHNPIWHMFSIFLGCVSAFALSKTPANRDEKLFFYYLRQMILSKKLFICSTITLVCFFKKNFVCILGFRKLSNILFCYANDFTSFFYKLSSG